MKALQSLNYIPKVLLHTFFPNGCVCCGKRLNEGISVCLSCEYNLSISGFQKQEYNPMEKKLWGRAQIEKATCPYILHKDSSVQKIIHAFKYQHQTDLAKFIGDKIYFHLKQYADFTDCDYILPVPMHPKKQKARGFNQAEEIARHLSKRSEIKMRNDILLKSSNIKTQTKKARWQRWLSTSSSYAVQNPQELSGKSILLVDDVFTTGATIDVLANLIHEHTNCKIYVATFAMTGSIRA